MTVRTTTKDFIKRSKVKFGDRFDYKYAHYVDHQTPVVLVCKKHGCIKVKPHQHMNLLFGCRECGLDTRRDVRRHSTDKFVKRSREIHGDKFDYARVKYHNARTKVTIRCSEHGLFETTPDNHLSTKGGGCSKCRYEIQSLSVSKDTEFFIENAISVHGDRYDYSRSNYAKARTPVEIICKKHGSFYQTPNAHTAGKGCKQCGLTFHRDRASSWDQEAYCARFKETNLYVFKITSIAGEDIFYKIGISVNVERRSKEIHNASGSVYKVEPVYIFTGNSSEILKFERLLLNDTSRCKYLPQIDFAGKYECLSDIGYIEDLLGTLEAKFDRLL